MIEGICIGYKISNDNHPTYSCSNSKSVVSSYPPPRDTSGPNRLLDRLCAERHWKPGMSLWVKRRLERNMSFIPLSKSAHFFKKKYFPYIQKPLVLILRESGHAILQVHILILFLCSPVGNKSTYHFVAWQLFLSEIITHVRFFKRYKYWHKHDCNYQYHVLIIDK